MNLTILEIILSNNYFQITINLIQKYAWANFKDLTLFEVIKIDFKLCIKDNWKRINIIT